MTNTSELKQEAEKRRKLYRARYRDKHFFGGNTLKALQRDGFKCTLCSMTNNQHVEKYGVRISLHHKNGLGKNSKIKDNRLSNLQTLCLPCHSYADNISQLKSGKHKKQKITIDQVVELRSLYDNGATTEELATIFGIHRVSVHYVAKRLSWRWVS